MTDDPGYDEKDWLRDLLDEINEHQEHPALVADGCLWRIRERADMIEELLEQRKARSDGLDVSAS